MIFFPWETHTLKHCLSHIYPFYLVDITCTILFVFRSRCYYAVRGNVHRNSISDRIPQKIDGNRPGVVKFPKI